MHTTVLVQTPFSMSHTRTVESKPQLYASFTFPGCLSKTTFDTRAVCDLRTETGAFRFGRSKSVATFRLFFLSSGSTCSTTSSDEGTVVSHRPIRPSQDDVRR